MAKALIGYMHSDLRTPHHLTARMLGCVRACRSSSSSSSR